ncbi:hypothetical protein [Ekhidna sp.]|uniref:hypothetical protein n=1 Tax=Ekhidna sp. TaxID=2608089 RepID=UPI003B5AE758
MKRLLNTLVRSLIVALAIMLFACEPALEDPYENFIIPAGKHDNGWKMQSLQSKTLNFTAIFDQSAIYETVTTENQHDINKLMGFSDCNSMHHENSARFGWRWLAGKLEIHAYAYVNGERITEYIGDVELDEPTSYQLQITDDHYVFYLQGYDPVRIKREATCSKGLYYMLFPYFGGDEVAPHNILIQILTKY